MKNMEEEGNLLDYLYVLVKWRRMIVLAVLAVSLATAGISLILPKAWTATTTLLPPEKASSPFAASTLLSMAVPGNLAGLVGDVPSEQLVTILKSKRVLGAIVDRFGLVQEFEAASRDRAMDLLEQQVEEDLRTDGTLVIAVTASSPSLAAELANAMAAELDLVNRERKSQQARALRRFLQERLQALELEFQESGRAMRRFQETYGLIDLEEQTAAAVEVARHIVLELALLEVKLGVATRQLGPQHENQRLLRLEVEELRRQLQALHGNFQDRAGKAAETALRSLGPSLKDLPELGFEYARLSLDIKIKEQIISYLGTRFEEAKYREALDTPTIQVLDAATPPETRSAPRRTVLVLVAAAVALVVSVVLAFVFESAGRLRSRNREKIEEIKQVWNPGSRGKSN